MQPTEPAFLESAFNARLRDTDPVPDQPFRVAFGCYIGTILTTAVVAACLLLRITHPAVLIAATITTSHFSIILGLLAIRDWRYAPERLGRDRKRWSFAVLGLGLAALGFVVPTDSTGILVTTVVGGLLTALVGIALAGMARNRYVAVWCVDSEPVASWEAPKPWAVRARRATAFSLVFGVAYGALVLVFDEVDLLNVVAYSGAFVVILAPTPQALDVYERGLVAESKLSGRIYRWETLDGYQLTDSELRIRRSWLPDMRFDREEIEDIDAVVAALDEAPLA